MKDKITNIFKRDPYAKLLNMELLEWDEVYAKTAGTLTEDMQNFHFSSNGGIIFSLADYAFAVASNSHGQIAVGINKNMSFTCEGHVGECLILTAMEKAKTDLLAG